MRDLAASSLPLQLVPKLPFGNAAPRNSVSLCVALGSDTIAVGDANSLAGVLGSFLVDGGQGGGFDTLNINDQANTAGSTYTVAASYVDHIRSFGARVTYAAMEVVVVNAGSGDDSINVTGTQASTSVTVLAGAGIDTFHLGVAGSVLDMAGGLAIDGGSGKDWLDYANFNTAVSVDMVQFKATGVSTGGLTHIENVLGGSARDVLTGDGNANILVGGGGDDVLAGNGGRDLLIGGAGLDLIVGGAGDDLLIGNRTAFDLNRTALQAVLSEWVRTDRNYFERVQHLRTGGGLNGNLLLNATTVFPDGAADVLIGGDNQDWFLVSGSDWTDQVVSGAVFELLN